MAKIKIKKNDNVMVISGKDSGKKGKILEANPSENTVIVEGVNIVKKHQKPRGAKQQGGIVEVAAPIDASNVLLICSKCGKPSRIGVFVGANGEKSRQCKKCGEIIDVIVKGDK